MNRVHLFELEDQPWCPAFLRDAATDYLRHVVEVSGQAALLAPKVAETLRLTGETRIVDLCSGGGGPLPTVLGAVRREGVAAEAVLTDFFPNVAALARVAREAGGHVTVEPLPVDATRVPARLGGLRTIFNAFHHFRPPLARRILEDAFSARQPIAVFELVGREPAPLVGILFSPLVALFVMPFVKPRRWTTFLFTYLLPVLPLFILWDGLVSCLRVYSEPELRALVDGLEAPDWTWEIGRLRLGSAPAHATWLVGRKVPPPA